MNGENVVVCGPMIGEFGWELMGFSSIVRAIKADDAFNSYKFIVMSRAGHYPIYQGVVDLFVPLPTWYTSLGLESASYGAVGLTSQIYSELIKYLRRFYKGAKDVHEFRTPTRHEPNFPEIYQHVFTKLIPTDGARHVRDNLLKDTNGGPILVVMPRYRVGVKQSDNEEFSQARNWHPLYWQHVINKLLEDGYTIAVCGTMNGIPQINYDLPNLIPVFSIDPIYIMDVTLAFMEKAMCTICSQSGGTHLSLQANTPTWVLGHERVRHSINCNPLETVCAYLETDLPYSNVLPEVALNSINQFISFLIDRKKGERDV
jgi:hypothetical protein